MRSEGFFQRVVRLGAVRGTLVMTLICVGTSLALAIVITTALHRLSVMGVFISLAIPAIIVPTTWYPFFLVSERLRAAEARLREGEEKYRSVLESMSEAYAEFDRRGRLLFFNEALCRITGYGRDELGTRTLAEFALPGDLRHLAEAAGRLRDGEERSVSLYDLPITAKDGTVRTLEATVSELPGQGERGVYRAVIRDVSERVDREHERQRYEEQLRHARKMEAIGTLAGGVAHDLNNVLSGIVGYPDLLLLDCREEGPLKTGLTAIKDSGERAAGIVRDLLTLSRRGVGATEVLNLNGIVGGYLASPEHALLLKSHPGITVTTELDARLLNVRGSVVHLSKALTNLVLNAFEAVPAGGTIAVATGNVRLDRPPRGGDRARAGDFVTLTVRDSGSGIAPEDLDRIFEPFYTKKALGRSGTGLGLAVVWGTVQDHDGSIEVKSEAGEGTAVTIFLPATREELPPQPRAPSIEPYRGRGERILVVDDLSDQRTLASKMLECLGYAPRSAASGEEALDLLAGSSVDLVLLDMIMDPGMDGLETCRRLRERLPGMPVVIASGYAETGRIRQAVALGDVAFLKKPYSLEALARAVHGALRPA